MEGQAIECCGVVLLNGLLYSAHHLPAFVQAVVLAIEGEGELNLINGIHLEGVPVHNGELGSGDEFCGRDYLLTDFVAGALLFAYVSYD